MNTQVCSEAHVPLTSTPGAGIASTAGAALAAISTAWDKLRHRPQVSLAHVREVDALADINVHTLKDIGAPNWMVAQASLREDGHALRMIDLYRS